MDEYWTYRRVRCTHQYPVDISVPDALVSPIYVSFSFRSAAAGYTYNIVSLVVILHILASVYSSVPYLLVDDRFDARFFARLSDGAVEPECKSLEAYKGGYTEASCQAWDWLDVVEEPGSELFIKTFIQETLPPVRATLTP